MRIVVKQYKVDDKTDELVEVPLDDCDDMVREAAQQWHGKEMTPEQVDELIAKFADGD